MRTQTPMLLAAVLLVGVTVGVATDPAANVASPPALTPETVLASLNASIEWYRQARVTMREANRSAGALFAQEDQETARQALQRIRRGAPAPPCSSRLRIRRPGRRPRRGWPGRGRSSRPSIKAEEQRASRGAARERAAGWNSTARGFQS